MNGHAAAIAVIIVLFAFSAVLALSETAFVRASRIRMLNLAEEGDKRADRILRLLDHPEQTLNSVLLVLLACQMISATLLGTVLEPTFGAVGCHRRHGDRDHGGVHVRGGRAEDVRGAAHRPRGAVGVGVARRSSRSSGRCAC